MQDDNKSSENKTENSITINQLVNIELERKFKVVERYDSILWKIRSGYVVILYGSLSLFVGKDASLITFKHSHEILFIILLLIWGLSICAFIIDFEFLVKKLKVVNASNKLQNKLMISIHNKFILDIDKIRELMSASGESVEEPFYRGISKQIKINIYITIPLYFSTPIVSSMTFIKFIR
jgi:hypothetical protein